MAYYSKLVILLFLVFGLLFGAGDDVKAICPDGSIDGVEQCDPPDFGTPAETCSSQGYLNGVLKCDGSCAFDFSDCCGQDPTVDIVQNSTIGAGGEIREYNLNITNNDVAGCVGRGFALVLTGLPDPCPGAVFNPDVGLFYPRWEWDLGIKDDLILADGSIKDPSTITEWDSVGTVQTTDIPSNTTLGVPFIVISCDSYTPIHTETFTITVSEGAKSWTDTANYVIDSVFEVCDDAGRNDEDGQNGANSDDRVSCYGFSDTCGNTTIEAAEDCEENSDCTGLKICTTNCICQDPPASNECAVNFDDCDCNIATGVNGCETDLLTDPNHCGMCGKACLWGCEDGVCLEPKGGLVPCGRYADDLDTLWNEEESCSVCHLIILSNNVIDYLFKMVGIIAVLSLVIGGLLYITATGNSSLMTKAKTAFNKALTGFVIVFIAWIAINTVMVLFGFDDPLEDGNWKIFSCDVDMTIPDHSYCGDGIVQATGNGDGQIEECDPKETKVSYLTNNPGKTAEDWVKNIYSCNPTDCKLRCQSPPNPPTLPDQIGTGCYLSGGCTKGRFVCDIVDQDDPSKDVAVCKDTYNSAEYRIVGFACKEQLDYCCEGIVLPPESEFEIIRGPSGDFKCDDVCKTEGKICIGVGLRDSVGAGCSSLVHNLGSTCQNSGNLASNDCKTTFRGGSGFCQETLGTPTWSMGHGETACYCQ